jgi:hypothetical protein
MDRRALERPLAANAKTWLAGRFYQSRPGAAPTGFPVRTVAGLFFVAPFRIA